MVGNARVKWILLCIGGTAIALGLSMVLVPWATRTVAAIVCFTGFALTIVGGMP